MHAVFASLATLVVGGVAYVVGYKSGQKDAVKTAKK